jgi:predicted DNA-binding transcriptional regulator AlpA
MTVAQFAHKLKVDRSTVYRMISGKSLPPGIESKVIATRLVIEMPDGWKLK